MLSYCGFSAIGLPDEIAFVEVKSPYYESEAEAKALHEKFPKSCNLKCHPVRFIDSGEVKFLVEARVALFANGVNKGVNEAGVKRLLSIKKHCAKNGIHFGFIEKPFASNSVKVDFLEG